MPITIRRTIVHRLVKEQHEPIQKSQMRTTLLDASNDSVQKLVGGIADVYGTRSNNMQYGVFRASTGRKEFPEEFSTYAKLVYPTDQDFIDLSLEAMYRLQNSASQQTASSGGYIIFADFDTPQYRFLLIAMIKQKPGLTLSANLEPEELMQLDLSKLHQAARINIGSWVEYEQAEESARSEMNYLSFVSPSSNSEASGYFVSALGCKTGSASLSATKSLIHEARELFKSPALKRRREAMHSALLAYLESKISKLARLTDVENIIRNHVPLDSDPSPEEISKKFIETINGEPHRVPIEFPPHKKEVWRNTHIKGASQTWDLSFDRKALGEDDNADIQYDKESRRIVLRRPPPELVEAIEKQLKEAD